MACLQGYSEWKKGMTAVCLPNVNMNCMDHRIFLHPNSNRYYTGTVQPDFFSLFFSSCSGKLSMTCKSGEFHSQHGFCSTRHIWLFEPRWKSRYKPILVITVVFKVVPRLILEKASYELLQRVFCFVFVFFLGGGYIHDTRDDTWCVSVSSVSTVSDPDYDDYFDNEFIQQHCKFHIFSFEWKVLHRRRSCFS